MSDAKQERLKKTALFANLERKELAALAEATTEVSVAEGTVLAKEGHSGHDAFVILEGGVDISIGGEKIAELGPDQIVGELALLLREPRQATITANSPLRVLVIEPGRFDALLEQAPGIARSLLVSLARRLKSADQMLHH